MIENLLEAIRTPILERVNLTTTKIAGQALLVKNLDNSLLGKSENPFKKLRRNETVTTNTPDTALVLSIKFSSSNTLVSLTDSTGLPILSFSSGLASLRGKDKTDRHKALTNLLIKVYHNYNSLKYDHNLAISLHLVDVGKEKKFSVEVAKRLFLVSSVKAYDRVPFNGCRKKKLKRKKTARNIRR